MAKITIVQKIGQTSVALLIKEKVELQKRDIELAIAGRGEYQICEEYASLAVDQENWWKMTPSQRRKKISAFFSITDSSKFQTQRRMLLLSMHQYCTCG